VLKLPARGAHGVLVTLAAKVRELVREELVTVPDALQALLADVPDHELSCPLYEPSDAIETE